MTATCSRLTRSDTTLVLDASAILNLLGTCRPVEILQALGRTCIFEPTAGREVIRDPSTGGSGAGALEVLMGRSLLERQRMNDAAERVFFDLVLADAPDGLDDGEAATLALAVSLGGCAVVDERKAVRVARTSFPNLRVISTLDLLSCLEVQEHIGREALEDAVFQALIKARMSVPTRFRAFVIETIGRERVAQCRSLRRPFNLRAV
jgi:predicted nucleic acid-binding protein